MAKTFGNIAGIPEGGKAKEVERLCETKYILGDSQVIQELMCYMSADELKDFNDHIERHYDLRMIEDQQIADYNEIPWEEIANG